MWSMPLTFSLIRASTALPKPPPDPRPNLLLSTLRLCRRPRLSFVPFCRSSISLVAQERSLLNSLTIARNMGGLSSFSGVGFSLRDTTHWSHASATLSSRVDSSISSRVVHSLVPFPPAVPPQSSPPFSLHLSCVCQKNTHLFHSLYSGPARITEGLALSTL